METMRVGSLVPVSIASVKVWPAAVVTSTTRCVSVVRGLASVAFGSSAARTRTSGW